MPNRIAYLLAALTTGLVAWLAWPPHAGALSLLLLAAFTPLLWMESHISTHKPSRSRLQVLSYGYVAFLTWNALTTWWVANASFGGAIFAILVNSLFMAVVFLAYHITKSKVGNALGYFSLPVYWLAFEFLHLRWEFSWPWLTLGNGFASFPAIIQWYEWTGVLGGSLWIWLTNLLLFRAWHLRTNLLERCRQNPEDTDLSAYLTIRAKVSITKISLLIALPVALSIYLLNTTHQQTANASIEVAVIQPNIDPYLEKFPGSVNHIPYSRQMQRMQRLMDSVVTPSTAVVVLPETALPGGTNIEDPWSSSEVQLLYQWLLAHPRTAVLIGMDGYEVYGEEPRTVTSRRSTGGIYYDAFNSAALFHADTTYYQMYHKSRLVPGVERMPYPGIFRFLERFVLDMGGITGSLGMQQERTTFFTPDSIGLAPIICYESIYGDYITDYVQGGATVLCIITNDGWWGNTAGYRQHLAYASLRAIETRRPVIRSANTGISAVLDNRGMLQQTTQWWQPTAFAATIQPNTTTTVYIRYGDVLGRLAVLLAVILLLYQLISGQTNGFYYRRQKIRR